MFEQTLVLSQARHRGADRRSMSLAALLHASLLAVLLAGQIWRVHAVPLPPETAVFVTWAPPPPPTPEPPRPTVTPPAPPERRDQAVAPAPIVPSVAPPTDLPAEVPVSPPSTAPTPPSPGTAVEGSGLPGELPPADGGFLHYRVGMTAPAVLSRVEPVYTEPARRAGRQGVVVLRAAIDRGGDVVRVDVVRSLGFGLDEEAVQAVRRWRFAPARRNGDPVGVLYTITVRYTLVR